ncbi:hypothetical protein L208DRAFT_1326266 [Tricholoma matsutake]|nr:hypothetical protein L208DRAFT_1326266 [Tricholoma matsutake 945]
MFNGKVKSVRPFLDKIESAVWLQWHTLITDYDKALFLSGYLKDGSPKSWYYTINNSATWAHLLWAAFLQAFHDHFGDLDCQFSATEEMDQLRQTSSCATFTSHFHKLLVDLDLNESLKIEYFCKRLKDNVQDALALIKCKDLPMDFDEYIKLCVSIDNSLHHHECKKKGSKPSGNNSSSTTKRSPTFSTSSAPCTPPAPPTVTPGTLIEIDAAKTSQPHAPLTNKEHERRRHEGLCSYCGGKHNIHDCPNMSKCTKKNFTARKPPPASGKA